MAETHPIENWRPIVGWEGLYEVSDLGRVRSLDRIRGKRFYPGRLLSLHIHEMGYVDVWLTCRPRESLRLVHTLVLEAFVGPRPSGFDSCHNNGVRTDNRLENLRWDTRLANMQDRAMHGNTLVGERNHKAKLTENDVREIRKNYKGRGQPELCAKYGISPSTLQYVLARKSWRNVI